ncbi:MAG TPA: hypothetical protein P5210_10675 [Draconibacterium sp.]|nr:hypothetical protein [Draconibacterium sp.]
MRSQTSWIHPPFITENDEWVRELSDNDGRHTATYLAAMSMPILACSNEYLFFSELTFNSIKKN